MAKTIQEKVLSSLIPNVYIDRVTLETSGDGEFIGENPHVDIEQREESRRPSNKKLKTNLDISICQLVENEGVLGWFSEDRIKSNLKIRVVQSKSQIITDNLLEDPESISGLKIRRTFTGNKSVIKGLDIKTFSVSSIIAGKSSEAFVARSSASQTESGQTKYDFSFSTTFNIGEESPYHLTYFAYCYLDLKSLFEEMGVSDTSSMDNISASSMYAQCVYKDDALVSQEITKSGQAKKNYKVHDHRIFETMFDIKYDASMPSISEQNSSEERRKVEDYYDSDTYFSDMYLSRSRDGSPGFAFSFHLSKFIEKNSDLGYLYKNSDEKTKSEILSYCKIASLKLKRKRVKLSEKTTSLGTVVKEPVSYTGNSTHIQEKQIVSLHGNKRTASSDVGFISQLNLALADGSRQLEGDKIIFFNGRDKEMKDLTDGLYLYSVEADIENGVSKYLSSLKKEMKESRKKLQEYYHLASSPNKFKNVMRLDNPHIDTQGERSAFKSSEITQKYNQVSGVFTEELKKLALEKYDNPKLYPWIDCVSKYIHCMSILYKFSDSRTTIDSLTRDILRIISPTTGSLPGLENFMKAFDELLRKLDVSFTDGLESDHSSEKSSSIKRVSNNLISIRKEFKDNLYNSNVKKFTGYDYLTLKDSESEGRLSETNSGGLKVLSFNDWKNRIDMENEKWFSDLETSPERSEQLKEVVGSRSPSLNDFSYLTPSEILYGEGKVLFNNLKAGTKHHLVMPDLILSAPSGEIEGGIPSPPPAPTPISGSSDAYYFSSEALLAIQNITLLDEREFDLFTDMELEITPPQTGVVLATDMTSADINVINKPDPEIEIITPSTCTAEERKKDIKDKVENINLITASFILPIGKNSKKRGIRKPPIKDKGTAKNSTNKLIEPDDKNISSDSSSAGNPLSVFDNLDNNVIKNLPNQFLNLFKFPDNAKFINDPQQASVYDLNIGLLNAVEYFDGYSITSTMSGRTIKTPLWKKLTRDDFNSLRGSFILCRMIKYTNNELGITRAVAIDNPVYDEYFLIECPSGPSRGKLATTKQYSNSILKEEWSNMLEGNTDSDVEYL